MTYSNTVGISQFAGVPSAGTNEVQRITIGGSPSTGGFTLTFNGETTDAITWSATNATLLSNIETALEALDSIDAVTVAAVSLTDGVGTIDVTFDGANVGKKAQPLMVITAGATFDGTVAIAEQTAGVDASFRGASKGKLVVDTTNGKLYINTGTAEAPTWTVVGSQS